jgi:hypothetical protein
MYNILSNIGTLTVFSGLVYGLKKCYDYFYYERPKTKQ